MIRLYEILPGVEPFAEDSLSTAKPSSFTNSPPVGKTKPCFQACPYTTMMTYFDQQTSVKLSNLQEYIAEHFITSFT